MTKLTLPFLETMITQSCNLSCLGCTNYSDLRHAGYVSWAQGQVWLEPWLDILNIPDFGIMGGEPLINPEVEEWILGTRALMPDSQIRFTTNGLLMHKHPDLLDLLHQVGNCVFKITVHVGNPQLEETIQSVFNHFPWEPVQEYGINRWRTTNNLRFQINRPTEFLKSYRNDYMNMSPHSSDPSAAFDACVQKTCPLLYNGRIYKCSTSALLMDTLEKFNRPNWEEWQPYIESGIGPDSAEHEIAQFISNFGKPHAHCGQCPTKKEMPIAHLTSVKYK